MRDGLRAVFVSATKTLVNALLIAAVAFLFASTAYRAVRRPPAVGAQLAIALAQQSVRGGAEDLASMARHYLGVSDAQRIDSFAQDRVDALRGIVKMKGWEAKEIEPSLYLVTFGWENPSAGEAQAIFFEVDTANRYVRPIVPDDELALRHGVRSKEQFDKDEATTAALIKKQYPDAAMTYANHVLSVIGKENGTYDPDIAARELHGLVRAAFAHRKDQFLKVEFAKGDAVGRYQARY